MRLIPVTSQQQLVHGTRVRCTLRGCKIKDGVLCVNPERRGLIYLCQSETDLLDGGHSREARQVDKDYAWALQFPESGALTMMHMENMRGLRIVETGPVRVPPPMADTPSEAGPPPSSDIRVTTTVLPNGRTMTTREYRECLRPVTTPTVSEMIGSPTLRGYV